MKLRAYRKSLGLSLQEAADALKCSVSQLSKIELGDSNPSPKLAARIVSWSGRKVQLADLLPDLADAATPKRRKVA